MTAKGTPEAHYPSLASTVHIITGGAGLLGRSHARHLLRQGARVLLADLHGAASAAAELNSEGSEATENVEEAGGCRGIAADVRDPDAMAAVVEDALTRWGRLDGLVNNAALDPKFHTQSRHRHRQNLESFPLAVWEESLAVNVTGMFVSAQAASRAMKTAGRGAIVNISSTYGLVGPDQRLYEREGEPAAIKPVTYSVSKAAVLGLTRYLATYFRDSGIRVNTLTPGGVFAGHDDEFVARYSSRTPLGRMARADEISRALVFLLADESSYMTGANLVVDGGWTAW